MLITTYLLSQNLPIARAEESFVNSEELHQIDEVLSKSGESLTPSAARLRIKSRDDLKSFYERTMKDGMHKYFWQAEGDFRNFSSDEELLNYVLAGKKVSASSWTYGMFPDYRFRKQGYDEVMFSGSGIGFGPKSIKNKELRIQFLLKPDAMIDASVFGRTNFDNIVSPPYFDRVSKSKLLKWYACLKFNPLIAAKCGKALDEIVVLMQPRSMFTAVPLIKEIINDPSYVEGASKAALKIMNKVEKYSPTNSRVPGDLFTDIFDSYKELGFSASKAEEMTWKLLAVYSTRGANIDVLFPFARGLPSSKTLIALETIANSVPSLDALTFASGHLYSLPREIFSTANYGKPYHFWMSAYLSWDMTRKYGEKAATSAAAIAETGYQVFSNTNGRESLFYEILKGDLMSPAVGKTKIDLAFGYAGAHYGSKRATRNLTNVKIDIDEAITKSLNFRNDISPMTMEKIQKSWDTKLGKMKLYYRWNSIMKPKYIYSNLVYSKSTDPSGLNKCSLDRALKNIFGQIPD